VVEEIEISSIVELSDVHAAGLDSATTIIGDDPAAGVFPRAELAVEAASPALDAALDSSMRADSEFAAGDTSPVESTAPPIVNMLKGSTVETAASPIHASVESPRIDTVQSHGLRASGSSSIDAIESSALDATDASATPAAGASSSETTTAAAEQARWRALEGEIRTQLLQRFDPFTDTSLLEKLGVELQPIVDRASIELVATINQQVGQLLRAHVAEAIEQEIRKWRHARH